MSICLSNLFYLCILRVNFHHRVEFALSVDNCIPSSPPFYLSLLLSLFSSSTLSSRTLSSLYFEAILAVLSGEDSMITLAMGRVPGALTTSGGLSAHSNAQAQECHAVQAQHWEEMLSCTWETLQPDEFLDPFQL